MGSVSCKIDIEGNLLMIRIVSDTSTLYSSSQAKEAGFTVCPLSVTIAFSGETP